MHYEYRWVVIALLALSTLTAGQIAAQAPTQPAGPTFEAATVKQNTSADQGASVRAQPGGRVTVTNNSLRNIIRNAYRLQNFQIVGGPEWINSDRWDIVAKAEGDAPPEQMLMMLRTLLADRFKLTVHTETRELPIYALVMAKPDGTLGPRLRPAAIDCDAMMARMKAAASGRGAPPPDPNPAGARPACGNRVGFGNIVAGGTEMGALANGLSPQVGRIIEDRTGLTGRFDFDLTWTPENLPRPTLPDQPVRVNGVEIDPNGPSLFTALQEQLGLKLESTKGKVEVLVIDRAEKPVEQ